MSAISPLSNIYLTFSKNSSKLKKLYIAHITLSVTYHTYPGFFIIPVLIMIVVHLLKQGLLVCDSQDHP